MTLKQIAGLVMCFVLAATLSGCLYVAAAGIGAYGGYKAKEEGYSLQSPITKEEPKKEQKKESK
jgi:hypothetical protein